MKNIATIAIIGLLAVIAINLVAIPKSPVINVDVPAAPVIEAPAPLTVEDICRGNGGRMGGYAGQTCKLPDQGDDEPYVSPLGQPLTLDELKARIRQP